MDKILIELDKNIKRCEDVLKENNYLEIVIAVEELTDKYKACIENIENNNDKVWNYTKKDLENIKEKLCLHKEKLVIEHQKSMILNMFDDMKKLVQINEDLPKDKIKEVIDIINKIEETNNKNISIDKKWIELRHYMIYLSTQDLIVASKIITIISKILQMG
ncbi:hypothetical protein [Romboutsia sp.]|uniref:hypothetical protein n=1 Tax=Romboutsia sp. TaxID=1965302 RepID=UPI002C3AF936|nr:hypothetical protein [Romboutsia sp.]HSQ89018.1 hypothetical protein [Romboutsia sp.]